MSDSHKQFDRFTIVDILGRGGMGTVYLALDEKLGRQVALKVLSEGELTAERRALFLREARAAAAIRHPNVATIYEVNERDDGIPYIAMEYCKGETLSRLIKSSPLSPPLFLKIATQIAEGLAAAHRNGVLHRDIKCANIVIEAEGLVKILDFGLAKLLAPAIRALADDVRNSATGNFFGTIHYISPEQARGISADARSDLFSVGVVFYEMATGKLPFAGDGPLEILEKIRSEEPAPFEPLDPGFPPALSAIIGKLLQKDRDNRYPDAASLAADLAGLERGREHSTSAAPTSVRQSLGVTNQLAEAPNRQRLLILLLVVLIGSVVFVRQRYRRPLGRSAAAAPARIEALAVLPFHNLSGGANDEFLSIGLADALVTRLQQIPRLQIRPTSAIRHFQGKTDVKQASEELKVDGILEGHFMADGPRMRVNLQLTDVRSGYGVWAGTIDGRRDNLMQLMDDVSAKTTTALNRTLGAQSATDASEPRSSNPEAFELYLKARAAAGSLRPSDHLAEVELLEDAIRLDPDFAAAHADLAVALSLGQVRGLSSSDNNRKAEWHARQAVRIDPNLPAAHLALGRTLIRTPDRFREAARENLAALRLNHNDPQALYTLVAYMVSSGELQRASCVGERLVSLDPSSNDVKTRGYWNVNSVDPEGMLAMSRIALASKETELAGRDMEGLAYLLTGQLEQARLAQQKAAQLVPDHFIERTLAAMISAERRDRKEVDRLAKLMKGELGRNHWAGLRMALCYARLGDNAEAVRWIKSSVALGNHSWYFLVKHPWLRSLQSEPEFQAVVARLKADLDDVRDDVVGVYQLICERDGR
ncbi:MAG TPA: protein kinase [Thermoanaerobaculia bacterium]|nr:protein kinase [Thermoanaerobaculia bacterium]